MNRAWWPHERWVMQSDLPPEALLRRLADSCGPAPLLFSPRSDKPFLGKVESDTFDICKNINYRNSFLPQMHGTIRRQGSGSSVEVTLQLHRLVAVFIALWLSGVGMGFLLTLGFAASGHFAATLVPAGMLIFGALLTLGGFKAESGPSRELLMRTLDVNSC